MKSVGCLLSVALLSLSTMVFAQSKPQEASGQSEMHKSMEKPAPTEAQKSFETMKTFAGDWEGPVTVNPLMPGMTDQPIRFDDGAAYEQMMGLWSRTAGDVFLDWLAPRSGLSWIDVGCGNGAFTELIVARCAPAEVHGIDPSEG